ncbi:uncharacterized protein RAG0_17041 [Rhynchosporium agropyri]|uniref:Uncharacterized protein n=1 Tax=Rhynchosporium agropyri TaxID=914238 RepID=A0A1E1LSS5_9HELO|nr:uncharacterized protein RAG0_17041 [Rhynchosporium agropyri]
MYNNKLLHSFEAATLYSINLKNNHEITPIRWTSFSRADTFDMSGIIPVSEWPSRLFGEAFWTVLEGIALLLKGTSILCAAIFFSVGLLFPIVNNVLFLPVLAFVVALSGIHKLLFGTSNPSLYTAFTDSKQVSDMLELKRISTPLPGPYIFRVTCTALEELWTVEIQPDILVDSSIALSHAARKVLCGIAVQLTYHQSLLLCCIKWEFSANEAIDQSWAFYFGQGDQDFSNPVQRYNAQTGDQISIEFASSCFAQIRELCEAGLRKKYCYSMNVARTFLQLGTSLHSDAEYIEYLCNQVYKFCFACLKHANFDSLLLRDWYEEKFGWSDIVELEKMTMMSEKLITPDSIQQAFGLATVAYCGLIIQQTLPASERKNHKLDSLLACLQILSRWDDVEAFLGEDIPLYLKDYIRNLQRQRPCETVSKP